MQPISRNPGLPSTSRPRLTRSEPLDRFEGSPSPPPRVRIFGGQYLSGERREQLRGRLEGAIDRFESDFGPVRHPVQVDVHRKQAAFRTGYDFVSDRIRFPDMPQIKNAGLDSDDVVHHELFHALVCKNYPHTAQDMDNPQVVRLHEALADYFAYQLKPDGAFGENYYKDRPEIRSYRNDLAVSLAPGAHLQGSAILAKLLAHDIQPAQIRGFLESGDFSLAALARLTPELEADFARDASMVLSDQAKDYPHSAKGRYRIESERALKLSFHPNAELLRQHPDLRISWTSMEGLPSKHYTISADGPSSFEVSALPGAEVEKMLALFHDGQRWIGSRPFYFGPAQSGTE